MIHAPECGKHLGAIAFAVEGTLGALEFPNGMIVVDGNY